MSKKGVRPKWLPLVCQVKGCDKKYHSSGMCTTHWGRWKRLGNPFALVELQVKTRTGICSKEKCYGKSIALDLCSQHYQQLPNRAVIRAKWRRKNKLREREYTAHRRALKLRATPSWVDRKELEKIYDSVPKHKEVDHIIPLNNPLVCGLHVPWNLQYLSPSANRKKSNKL